MSRALKGISGLTALLLTCLFLVFIMGIGARPLKVDLGKFQMAFTLVFAISMVSRSQGWLSSLQEGSSLPLMRRSGGGGR